MIKALTLWQPWAHCVMKRLKEYETRSWYTSYRGPLAIHAGKTDTGRAIWEAMRKSALSGQELPEWSELLRGYILGTVTLVDCIPTYRLHHLSDQERTLGDFGPDRYAWKLSDPDVFDEPKEWLGKQGLWSIELDDKVRQRNARNRIRQLRLFGGNS